MVSRGLIPLSVHGVDSIHPVAGVRRPAAGAVETTLITREKAAPSNA